MVCLLPRGNEHKRNRIGFATKRCGSRIFPGSSFDSRLTADLDRTLWLVGIIVSRHRSIASTARVLEARKNLALPTRLIRALSFLEEQAKYEGGMRQTEEEFGGEVTR
jgi:hypothetical protein